jgi:NADH-ubiquinone oxidoreductase chain 2
VGVRIFLFLNMLLNSLIFLLLSNSITSRRDKSILYSRIAITILLISAFIAYDNLALLFLAKGIGIFGGLFHTTATTNTFHVFIFFITGFILLLTSFYPRKVWLKDYSSPNRILFTKLIYYGTLLQVI